LFHRGVGDLACLGPNGASDTPTFNMYSVGYDLGDVFCESSSSASPLLLGDYYFEPDDVTRGVSFAEGFDAGLDGDWKDPESGSWPTLPDFSKLPSADPSNPFAAEGYMVEPFAEEPYVHQRNIAGVSLTECLFVEGSLPPEMPSDSFFELEATKLFFGADVATPVEAGNRILSFFRTGFPAKVTKVNLGKFSIRVQAFVGFRMCDIKVKIYRQNAGCTAEFQRRSGDTSAFQETYSSACHNLSVLLPTAELLSEVTRARSLLPETLTKALQEHRKASGAFLQPLFDMSNMTEEHLLVEAAAALAEVIEDPQIASTLRSMPAAMMCLSALMQCGQFHATLLAACACQAVARCEGKKDTKMQDTMMRALDNIDLVTAESLDFCNFCLAAPHEICLHEPSLSACA